MDDVSDFELNRVNNQVNSPLYTIAIVIDSSLLALSDANAVTSPLDRLAYWYFICDMFLHVIPRWNCHIHILFVETSLLDRVNDFGKELFRDN